MRRRLTRHLSYSNITATLALMVAVGGGTAYAAGLITGDQIASGAITSSHIQDRVIGINDLTSDTRQSLKEDAVAATVARQPERSSPPASPDDMTTFANHEFIVERGGASHLAVTGRVLCSGATSGSVWVGIFIDGREWTSSVLRNGCGGFHDANAKPSAFAAGARTLLEGTHTLELRYVAMTEEAVQLSADSLAVNTSQTTRPVSTGVEQPAR